MFPQILIMIMITNIINAATYRQLISTLRHFSQYLNSTRDSTSSFIKHLSQYTSIVRHWQRIFSFKHLSQYPNGASEVQLKSFLQELITFSERCKKQVVQFLPLNLIPIFECCKRQVNQLILLVFFFDIRTLHEIGSPNFFFQTNTYSNRRKRQ